ncbi:hypothetical protein HKBW3S43_00985 [Candidatus Hakubella thermalkaliphila]|uniref:4Fe-4S ferredoxin-type domain-containing protein n=2 Tax=Candidatus Hakubella thermalkaliphila TaxID=2754717 RepID=A0A6V8PSM5_9ACTN|nr:DUF362 domain-containing protein [Candidatus Hakubella thermalkaliphila]GFP20949.1 hypothetical protein HKBW3S06_00176 [Candidatus Hakubella thermalkaliphila]GFP28257.1 hypothetical protein HKBW3S33_01673 [Candidatus Hakubella thermalkaliphila]GFP35193.1 hypothetical protein HKBW3S43_00985 [Candidatus Hakubella thermalkaliphila]
MKPLVSVIRCPGYDQEMVDRAVRASITSVCDPSEIIRPGHRVLIKPNLLAKARPEKAVTTHPSLVRALINLVKELGAHPVVGDSPGGVNTEAAVRGIYRESGIGEVCRQEGVPIVDFETNVVEVNLPGGKLYRKMTVARASRDVDAIITVPKLKTHGFMMLTCGIKILFGLVPGLSKANYHLKMSRKEEFADMLLDLYSYAAPRLTVVDGVVAMEGNGPAHGVPRKLDLILASTDSVALDVVVSEVIGYRLEEVPTNLAAVKRGLTGELQDLEIVGEDLDEVRVSDFVKPITRGVVRGVPPFLKHLLKDISSPKPVSNESRCTLCRVCVDNCPSQAMRVEKERVLIDYQECIRCYCCHELCPEGAIELRVHPLARPFVHTGS